MPSRKTEEKSELHRLTDMDVDEVSFVDHGANRKRFLVVKRDEEGDAMGAELTSDGRGGFRTRTLKAAKEKPADEEEDKTKKPPFGGNKAPPFQAKPKKAEGDEEEDDEEEDDEEEDTSKAAGKKKPEDEEDDEPMAKKSVRKAALETLMECIDVLVGAAEELKDSDDDVEMSASFKKSLTDVANKLDKLCGGTAKGDLEKAGRRMSKERLDRFEKVVTELSGILKEVMASPELKDTEKRTSELLKRISKLMAGDSDSQVEELTGLVEDLQTEVKKSRAEIALLKKAAGSGGSNSTAVEKSDRRNKGNDEVEWPLDLNNPMTRDKTEKDVSFYD